MLAPALEELEATGIVGEKPLTPEDTASIARAIIGDKDQLMEALETRGSCDCSHQLPDGTRTRVNIFKVKGCHAIVMRALPTEIPGFEELALPEILAEIAALKTGLAVVTGPTGSGKSTTMAAIIDRINRTRPVHIVTLEDPIEFLHPHKLGTLNQRELGTDFHAFADGLRAALRQAPKVIFVGEIRDRESIEIALKAAETGHLVLSTLHTIGAGQTVNRIVGMFDFEEERLVRSRLSQVLRFVVGQRLLPKKKGGRVASLEIMASDLRVQELITNGEGDGKTYYDVIQAARSKGWQTFDQHIVELLDQDLITEEVAMAYASDSSVMHRERDKIRVKRGQETSEIGDLEMASHTPKHTAPEHSSPSAISPDRRSAGAFSKFRKKG
ncbi:MAG: type IV pilus twitching motility protein PilT [Planctomycetota bacterium]